MLYLGFISIHSLGPLAPPAQDARLIPATQIKQTQTLQPQLCSSTVVVAASSDYLDLVHCLSNVQLDHTAAIVLRISSFHVKLVIGLWLFSLISTMVPELVQSCRFLHGQVSVG